MVGRVNLSENTLLIKQLTLRNLSGNIEICQFIIFRVSIPNFIKTFCLCFLFLQSSTAFGLGLRDCDLTESEKEDSLIEHVWGGNPDDSDTYERRAYVFSYDSEHLVPRWSAWHATKEYRDTPKRKSRWSTFRTDPELPHVSDSDYVGWYDSEFNFARGHIVPYFISGGDRDNDSLDAEFERNLKVEDRDDACTVFEINAMSNIAPQFHRRFNGQPGVWWTLESDVRHMLDDGKEFQIFAGTVFLENLEVQRIGNRNDDDESDWKIGVPHGFFKILIDTNRMEAVGFLFDHAGDLSDGCDIDDPDTRWPSDCIVTIDKIEVVTGLNFFSEVSTATNNRLRNSSTKKSWLEWIDVER